MKHSWSNKSAVIIGGSAGLGLELAKCLAQLRASRIMLVGRDPVRLQHAQNAVHSAWPETRVSICAADVQTHVGSQTMAEIVTKWAASHQADEETRQQPHNSEPLNVPPQTGIDLLINAVGQSDRGLALQLTSDRLDELLRVNIYGPLLSTQKIAPLMTRGGVIVNIGSLSSLFAPRYLGGYSIAKHGLRAVTQQLRLELAERGIHVMLACPGPIQREDSGSRYSQLASAGDVPMEALQGGGGARLKGLDPQRLSRDILDAAAARKIDIIRPRKARLLLWLITLWPRLGERVLSSQTS